MTPSERAALIAEMTSEELRRWSLHVFAQLAPDMLGYPNKLLLENYDTELQEIIAERTCDAS